MRERIKSLLVQARHDPVDALVRALEEQSIEIVTAGNCAQAARVLGSDGPPHLVFTEVELVDGGWADVLNLAANACVPVNVIVLAPFVDVGFYVETIERGAFDFIVAPHSDPELVHVIRTAAGNAVSRRQKRLPTSPPAQLLADFRRTEENHGKARQG